MAKTEKTKPKEKPKTTVIRPTLSINLGGKSKPQSKDSNMWGWHHYAYDAVVAIFKTVKWITVSVVGTITIIWLIHMFADGVYALLESFKTAGM